MISIVRAALELSLGTALTFTQTPPSPVPTPPEVLPVDTPADPAGAPAPTPAIGPPPIPYSQPSPAPPPAPPPPRRLVFAFLPSLTMGISPLPSANVAALLGGRLPRSAWALGYQFTFASGLAERYTSGVVTHRHHLTAMRSFGARDRGFTSVGGGAAFLERKPVVEAEGRVGLRFGRKRYGVVALQLRLGWDIGHHERAPMPQFGAVFGFAFL